MTSITSPRVDRPGIPKEYGVGRAKEWVEWAHVEERLTAERVYWVATVGPTGRPRIRPVDGVYVDGTLWVGGSPKARWVQDIAGNPNVAIHLASTDDVVIVEGEAEMLTSVDPETAERVAAASVRKFPEYEMTAETYVKRGGIVVRPRKVVAWTNFMSNPTRFRPG
jgi:nitroimidazol reductase NimA-like FMN-containing flavoprotein (pyridoxamine 5'-phosphate oxidase superfamily)